MLFGHNPMKIYNLFARTYWSEVFEDCHIGSYSTVDKAIAIAQEISKGECSWKARPDDPLTSYLIWECPLDEDGGSGYDYDGMPAAAVSIDGEVVFDKEKGIGNCWFPYGYDTSKFPSIRTRLDEPGAINSLLIRLEIPRQCGSAHARLIDRAIVVPVTCWESIDEKDRYYFSLPFVPIDYYEGDIPIPDGVCGDLDDGTTVSGRYTLQDSTLRIAWIEDGDRHSVLFKDVHSTITDTTPIAGQ